MTQIVCSPDETYLAGLNNSVSKVLLYGRPKLKGLSCCGAQVKEEIIRSKYLCDAIAWDLVTIALSVIAADSIALREKCSDGWTRQIDLSIAVSNKSIWNLNKNHLESILRFLTTDIWTLTFLSGGEPPPKPTKSIVPIQNCVTLLSGGLDSLVGLIDLVTGNQKPIVVSQIVKGDRQKQIDFCSAIGNSLHLQLTHSMNVHGKAETSQRARSLIFLAYGALAATTLKNYAEGKSVTLYVCENGLISVNPPLTQARLGSLSTRTTHPVFLNSIQKLFKNLGIRVDIVNPYQFSTKGEMLLNCKDQKLLSKFASKSTSCGRYLRNGFKHCGRCIPCLIRRASFKRWGKVDRTGYVYSNLGLNDFEHARFDDVRSIAMAIRTMSEGGVDSLLGATLVSSAIDNQDRYAEVVSAGLTEVKNFLGRYKIK